MSDDCGDMAAGCGVTHIFADQTTTKGKIVVIL